MLPGARPINLTSGGPPRRTSGRDEERELHDKADHLMILVGHDAMRLERLLHSSGCGGRNGSPSSRSTSSSSCENATAPGSRATASSPWAMASGVIGGGAGRSDGAARMARSSRRKRAGFAELQSGGRGSGLSSSATSISRVRGGVRPRAGFADRFGGVRLELGRNALFPRPQPAGCPHGLGP